MTASAGNAWVARSFQGLEEGFGVLRQTPSRLLRTCRVFPSCFRGLRATIAFCSYYCKPVFLRKDIGGVPRRTVDWVDLLRAADCSTLSGSYCGELIQIKRAP